MEYLPQFYNEQRGDVVLNPMDARCPFWSPGDEVPHEAEALTLAASLFPDRGRENRFFVEAPRKIFAHLWLPWLIEHHYDSGVCIYDGVLCCASHFTGKERDTESGLDYFGARYYASSMGRFMSPDDFGGHLENPQILN